MAPLLRPRIKCFYCGSRSAHAKGAKLRQFQCTFCEATNYLDENGDIRDVPATATPRNETFATARPKSSSPTANLPSSDELFCAVCLKNQHFLTECLSNYLPPEDDPRYQEFVEGYPKYREGLERRYPQVCARCGPGVRNRMRQTARVANSDNLNRALARPREYHGIEWIALFLRVARWMFYTSLLVQALWHILGMSGMLEYDTHVEEVESPSALHCLYMGTQTLHFGPRCSALLAEAVKWSMISSLAFLWWNPTTINRHQQSRRAQKTKGHGGFYGMQACMIAFRLVAWLVLRGQGLRTRGYQDSTIRACHGFMFLFLAAGTFVSLRSIKKVPIPTLSMKDAERSLVDENGFTYPADNFTSQRSARPPTDILRTPSAPRHFPISRLAPRSNVKSPAMLFESAVEAPLTSSYESDAVLPTTEDDPMAMDWEPIQQTPTRKDAPLLRPRALQTKESPPAFAQPATSPFYGRLPAAPKSMEHRLRNNARQPAPQFNPTPESKQKDWFQKMRLSNSFIEPKTRKPTAKQAESESSSSQGSRYMRSIPSPEQRTMDLQEPRWTLKSDIDAVNKGTGLEDLFTQSFKIDDEPDVHRSVHHGDAALFASGTGSATVAAGSRILSFLALVIACGVAAKALDAFRRGKGLADVIDQAEILLERVKDLVA